MQLLDLLTFQRGPVIITCCQTANSQEGSQEIWYGEPIKQGPHYNPRLQIPQLSYPCQTTCSNLEMPHVLSLRCVPSINVIIYTCQKLPPTLLSFDLNEYHCNHLLTIYTPPASYYPFLKHHLFLYCSLSLREVHTACTTLSTCILTWEQEMHFHHPDNTAAYVIA